MKFLSVCSGIEAASLAWKPLGFDPVAFSEIAPFQSNLLRYHYPEVPNWGDMTNFKNWDNADINVLVGGTPCQSYSLAGLREGLDDPRGSLMLTFGAVARRYKPEWVVWENVAGVLSSNGGRDLGSFFRLLEKCGYGFAYRVLDAQYFGVPQRRRRVFVVGRLGDWRAPAAVLFERESLSGNPEKSTEARSRDPGGPPSSPSQTSGSRVARPLLSSAQRGDYETETFVKSYAMRGREEGNLPEDQGDKTSTIRGSSGGSTRDLVCFTARQDGSDALVNLSPTVRANASGGIKGPAFCFSSKDDGSDAALDLSPTLRSGSHDKSHLNGGVPPAVCFSENSRQELRTHDLASSISSSTSGKPGQGTPHALFDEFIRRLTPLECERLQGLPDNYTNVAWRGKPASDSRRYEAIGNSIAVPVLEWIGKRIVFINSLM